MGKVNIVLAAIVVPILVIIAGTLLLTALLLGGITLANQLGYTDIPFQVGFLPVNGPMQIVVTLIAGFILVAISGLCIFGIVRILRPKQRFADRV